MSDVNLKPVIVVEPQKVQGMSIALVAQQVLQGFEGRMKFDVVESTSPSLVKETFRRPVIVTCPGTFFSKWRDVGRYMWPSLVISLFSANWQDYPEPWHAFYLTSLLKPPASTPVFHVSHSKATDLYMKDTIRRLFNPSIGRQMTDVMDTIPYGVDLDFQFGAINDVKRGSTIAPFNRVNQQQKNIKLHEQLTKEYYAGLALAMVEPPRTVFYHVNMPGKDYSQYEETYDLRSQPADRAEYKATARTFEQFLCTANYESFGIYYLELLLSGVIGTFVSKQWVKDLLPGYDLIVQPSEAPAAMLHVHRNIGTYRKKLLEVTVPMIRTAYAIDRFNRDFAGHCQRLIEVNCKGTQDGHE